MTEWEGTNWKAATRVVALNHTTDDRYTQEN